MLSIIEVILISQVPRVVTHTSHPDLHSVLYLHRSVQYWLFMTAYFSAVFVSAVLWLQLLTNKSTHWFARPLGHLLLTRRSFSWGEVLVVALMTLLVASIPEVAARALFIKRYGAPKTVLLPYWERFDRNMAMFGFTKRKDHLAQNDFVAFRQAGFSYRPYVGFTSLPDFKPRPTPSKRAFRVFFVGGSAMEISARPAVEDLQLKLNRRGCNVEIINAGRSAYVSGQEAVMTLTELLPLQPDLVIVFNGYNDLSRVEEGEAPGTPEYTRAMAASFEAGLDIYKYLLNDLSQRSFLVQQLRKTGRQIQTSDAEEDLQPFDQAVEVYASNIDKMASLANAYNYRLFITTQPLVFFKDKLGAAETELMSENSERARLYRRYFPELIARARKIAADRHASYTDLTRVFAGMLGDVFYDTVHFDGANQAVRDVLSAQFESMVVSAPGACQP
jgi:lysophospholipase L1-like esterase